MFRTGFLSIIRIKIRMELSSTLIPLASSQQNMYDIYLLLCIQYQTPDDGQKTCPKHVEFYSKNKFEILVHLIGFTIRLYHDERSSERQIWCIEITHTHTHTHDNRQDSSERVIGQSPRLLPNTQYSPERDVSAIGGIRNGNPNKRAAADSGLKTARSMGSACRRKLTHEICRCVVSVFRIA